MVEITDTVVAIDRFRRTIAFAGIGGKTWTIIISPSVQCFPTLRLSMSLLSTGKRM